MNPKAKKFNVRRCVVCDYPFSDAHHTYPQSKGGQETIFLCPNHHRFANIVQVILVTNEWFGDKKAKAFAELHFDKAFNEKILDRLIIDYYSESCDITEKREHEEFIADMSPEQLAAYNKSGEWLRKIFK